MTVIKIGGAFVASTALPDVVDEIRRRYRPPLAFVAGGGAAADLVRRWYRELELDDADAHWLAIRAMSVQADLLARRLGLPLIEDFKNCRKECVLDLWTEFSRSPHNVPIGWHVTSDSLAAWAAKRLEATRLVAVKAVGGDATSTKEASQRNWVDPYFLEAARELRVEWLNPNALARPTNLGCIRGNDP